MAEISTQELINNFHFGSVGSQGLLELTPD